MSRIIGANHRAMRIEITLPVDADGEYAFDEDDKPVKGRTPVTLHVPRLDSISEEQFKQLVKELDNLDSLTGDDGEPLSQQDKSKEAVMVMLRPFVTDDESKLLSERPQVELEQIAKLVREASAVSVGELLASYNSSKSSARPSKRTSSASDSESETSETN